MYSIIRQVVQVRQESRKRRSKTNHRTLAVQVGLEADPKYLPVVQNKAHVLQRAATGKLRKGNSGQSWGIEQKPTEFSIFSDKWFNYLLAIVTVNEQGLFRDSSVTANTPHSLSVTIMLIYSRLKQLNFLLSYQHAVFCDCANILPPGETHWLQQTH